MVVNESTFASKDLLEIFSNKSSNLEKNLNQSQYIMDAMKELIKICGDDPDVMGSRIPMRVLKAFLEYTEGYHEDPKKHLEKVFDVDHQELILVRDIEFYSMCEHHFAPFYGVAHVGYIPNEKVTGLSKIGRMVEGYAKRFQVQERLTNQIAEAMEEILQPQGTMVVVEAKHMCMCSRGVKKANSSTTTTSTRGIFKEQNDAKLEFLTLLNR